MGKFSAKKGENGLLDNRVHNFYTASLQEILNDFLEKFDKWNMDEVED